MKLFHCPCCGAKLYQPAPQFFGRLDRGRKATLDALAEIAALVAKANQQKRAHGRKHKRQGEKGKG